MHFYSSFVGLPKSSSALSSEMQRPNRMHRSMPSDKKIQQDEDERNPSFMQLQKEKLSIFWKQQKEEILHSDPKRKHELPISRIKRAMKSNDQVQMVSTHSTLLLSKAIEMFIRELTVRAWMQADQVKRQTLKHDDFARAIRDEELFKFLSDIVPLQTHKVGGEANDGQGNEAYQNFQPNDIPVEVANDIQGNKFHLANRMVQPHNIPVEGNTDDGQDNEFHPAYQMVQLDNIPVEKKAKYGQGNKFQSREFILLSKALIEVFDVPAHQMVQPNNIRVSVPYPGQFVGVVYPKKL